MSESRGQSPAKITNVTGENDDSAVDSGVAYFESHPDHVTPKNRDIQMDWATHIFLDFSMNDGDWTDWTINTTVHGSKHKKHKGLPFANPHSYLIMFTYTISLWNLCLGSIIFDPYQSWYSSTVSEGTYCLWFDCKHGSRKYPKFEGFQSLVFADTGIPCHPWNA